jgi:hypothetical protein
VWQEHTVAGEFRRFLAVELSRRRDAEKRQNDKCFPDGRYHRRLRVGLDFIHKDAAKLS